MSYDTMEFSKAVNLAYRSMGRSQFYENINYNSRNERNNSGSIGVVVNIDNLLYSGFDFSSDEDLLKFHIKLLNSVFLIGIFFTTLFATMSLLGINTFSHIHEISLYLYAGLSIILLLFTRRDKNFYSIILHLFLFMNYLLFSEALFFVPEDPFRMIWFYIVVYLAFVFKGSNIGFLYTFLSVITIVIYETLADIPDVELAIMSSTLGLIIMSFLFHVYTRKMMQYEQSLEKESYRLKDLAITDTLTQAKNRNFFTQLSKKLFTTVKHENGNLLLFLIDIDLFKKINDTYGHQAGDKVLRDTASLIQKKLPSSIVLTRIGGEEFAFLCTALTIEEGKVLAEEIRVAVEREKFVYLKDTIKVRISIGITSYKQDDNFFKEIFSRADSALYKAKNKGRNQVQIQR